MWLIWQRITKLHVITTSTIIQLFPTHHNSRVKIALNYENLHHQAASDGRIKRSLGDDVWIQNYNHISHGWLHYGYEEQQHAYGRICCTREPLDWQRHWIDKISLNLTSSNAPCWDCPLIRPFHKWSMRLTSRRPDPKWRGWLCHLLDQGTNSEEDQPSREWLSFLERCVLFLAFQHVE